MSDWELVLVPLLMPIALTLAAWIGRRSGSRLLLWLFLSSVVVLVSGALIDRESGLRSPVVFDLRPGDLVVVLGLAISSVGAVLGIWRWRSGSAIGLFALLLLWAGSDVEGPAGGYLIALSVGFGVLGILVLGMPSLSADRDTVTRRRFGRYPRRRIADWRDGEIAVAIGRVSSEEPIVAPLSRRSCVLAEYVVESLPVDSSFWIERERKLHRSDFALRDASGEALVMAADAELLLMKDVTTSDWRDAGHDHRRREGVAEVGELVAVVGRGNYEPDPRPSRIAGYRDRPTVLVIRGTRRERLRVSDSPALTGRS